MLNSKGFTISRPFVMYFKTLLKTLNSSLAEMNQSKL